MLAALLSEVVMTAFFLMIILGATDKGRAHGFAPIAIGFADLDPPDQHSRNEHVNDHVRIR